MSGHEHERTLVGFLDYIGLGLILSPIEEVSRRIHEGHDITFRGWIVVIASLLAGAFAIYASKRSKNLPFDIKPYLQRIAPKDWLQWLSLLIIVILTSVSVAAIMSFASPTHTHARSDNQTQKDQTTSNLLPTVKKDPPAEQLAAAPEQQSQSRPKKEAAPDVDGGAKAPVSPPVSNGPSGSTNLTARSGNSPFVRLSLNGNIKSGTFEEMLSRLRPLLPKPNKPCQMIIFMKPNSLAAKALGDQIMVGLSGIPWAVANGSARTYDNSMRIAASSSPTSQFCGIQLAQRLLEKASFPFSYADVQTSLELAACPDCTELIIGDVPSLLKLPTSLGQSSDSGMDAFVASLFERCVRLRPAGTHAEWSACVDGRLAESGILWRMDDYVKQMQHNAEKSR